MHQDVFKRSTAEVGAYVNALRENSKRDGVFDSAAAQDFVSSSITSSLK